jgi:hypothetical protein
MKGAMRELIRRTRGDGNAGQARPLLATRFAPADTAGAVETAAPTDLRFPRAEPVSAAPSPRSVATVPTPRASDASDESVHTSDALSVVEVHTSRADNQVAAPAPSRSREQLEAIVTQLSRSTSAALTPTSSVVGSSSSATAEPRAVNVTARVAEASGNAATPSSSPLVMGRHVARPEFRAPAFETAPPAPEVHIHIGRVELTALAAPAKTATRRAESKPALSLDEYLRQRNAPRGGRA